LRSHNLRVQAIPRTDFIGWWALGKNERLNPDRSLAQPMGGGKFFPNGQPVDLEVTDAELAELQGPPNDAYLVVA
jgi:hypothetical protein